MNDLTFFNIFQSKLIVLSPQMCLSRSNLTSYLGGLSSSPEQYGSASFFHALEISDNRNKGLCLFRFHFQRIFLWKMISLSLSFAKIMNLAKLPDTVGSVTEFRAALSHYLVFLFWLDQFSPSSVLIAMNNDLCSLSVIYLWYVLAHDKNLSSFPFTVFFPWTPSSGSPLVSDLGHLSLGRTPDSLLPDSTLLMESLLYDNLILFSCLRASPHLGVRNQVVKSRFLI